MNRNPVVFEDFGNIEIIYGKSTHDFPVHIHQSECYGMLTSGSAVFFCGKRKILKAGDGYWIPSSAPHSFAAIDGGEYAYKTICVKNCAAKSNEDGWLRRVKSYILENAAEDLDIDALSKHVHLSKFHLIRKFKDEYGLSPYQYYMNVRIEKIRHGLLLGQSLPDLAYELGFSHQSHMCNVFKRYMGITPTQYQYAYTAYSSAGENVARINKPSGPAITL